MRTQMTTIAIAVLAGAMFALPAQSATKDDAVAMVKKTVDVIKAEGTEKAYAEINAGGKFVDGEVYVVVLGSDGTTLAHATNPKLIGKNMMEVQDVDGKYFTKDMVTMGQKQASFWYDFKFANPVTKKIQVKDMYCESQTATVTIVCAGVYRP